MCWSGEASTLLATAGLGTTVYAATKGEDKSLWMPLGYFSLMEALQAFSLNEFVAVWCLYSIGLLLIVIKTPVRKILFVRH